ncbi:MAG: MBL fold metallo-hydrolase [Deltaproteobacteria bacterium]|nr:MBL fold metallo-hydrolase [Deltaproteobacteria bacterium]
MYPKQLTESVFLLGNPFVSIYLVKGGRFSVLVEAGLSVTAPQIADQLKQLEIDPTSLRYLILTHTHADHVMGAPLIKEALPHIKIAAVREARDLRLKPKITDFFTQEDAYTSKRLLDFEAVDPHLPQPTAMPVTVQEIISPDDTLDLGEISLHILDAPGHCRGGIALWEPREKTIFCSDSMGFHLPSGQFVSNFYVDYDAYRNTFETLCKLKPEWICPGHCGAYGGKEAKRFMAGAKRELDWITDYVTAQAHSKEALIEAADALFQRYFVDEATIFSPENTKYCMELLIRRILESKTLSPTVHSSE